MTSLLLAAALASGALAQGVERGSWFDGAGPAPAVPSAQALRTRPSAAPKSEPPTPDLEAAAQRWANPIQAARIAPAGAQETVRISIIGDAEPGRFFWERIFSPGKDVFARQVKAIHAGQPRTIVQLGDFVSHGTVERYRAHVAFLDNQVTLPYLSVIGNHDRSSPNGNADKRLYKAVFKESDYATDIGGWRLILLDTADRKLTEPQLAWLEEKLRSGGRALVFMHVPPAFLKGRLVSAEAEKNVDTAEGYHPFQAFFDEGSDRFRELAERYGVARVYMGHIHAFGVARLGGVRYVLSGGGGSPLYPLPPGSTYPAEKFAHYIDAELRADGVHDTVRKLDGSSFPIER